MHRLATIVVLLVMVVGSINGSLYAEEKEKERRRVITTLSIERPWLGVSVQSVTAELANEKNLKKNEGAYITRVHDDSPAKAAGIQEGDVIIRFGERFIYDAEGLTRAVRRSKVGDEVSIVVLRNGRETNLKAMLKEYPGRRIGIIRPEVRRHPGAWFYSATPRIGLRLLELNPQLGEYFQVPGGEGLLVEEVIEGSAAEKAGFMAGDVIVQVGDEPVKRMREFRRSLSEYDDGDEVPITYIRRGSRMTASVTVERPFRMKEFTIRVPEFDFRPEDFQFEIFSPEDRERLRFQLRDIEKELRPKMEELRKEMEQLKERLKEIEIKIREDI